MKKRRRIDVMIDAHVWMRRQAVKQGEKDMATLVQVKAHLTEMAKPYGLRVKVREVYEEERGRCLRATLSNMRDPPGHAWSTVPWSEFERDGVAVFDDHFKRAAPSLANAYKCPVVLLSQP
jgi:hypothetical protein